MLIEDWCFFEDFRKINFLDVLFVWDFNDEALNPDSDVGSEKKLYNLSIFNLEEEYVVLTQFLPQIRPQTLWGYKWNKVFIPQGREEGGLCGQGKQFPIFNEKKKKIQIHKKVGIGLWKDHNRLWYVWISSSETSWWKQEKKNKIFPSCFIFLLHSQLYLHPWRTVISRFKIQYQVRHRHRGERGVLKSARAVSDSETLSEFMDGFSEKYSVLTIAWGTEYIFDFIEIYLG